MGLDFPAKIINSPALEPVLSKVFSYHADVYNLEEYEGIRAGFGKAIWELVCAEKDFQEAQMKFHEPNLLKRVFG